MNLYIDACARTNSRTRKLAYSLLDELNDYVTERRLYDMNIPLLDEDAINEREYATRYHDTNNPFVSLATEFRDAERIIIAAPYWDLSYPAILRSYLEAIMVNGVTFCYDEEGRTMGLCEAKELIYITTSGGPITKPNLGYSHIRDLALHMLGIRQVFCFAAEGLDVVGVDANAILEAKMRELKVFRSDPHQQLYAHNNILVVDDSKVNTIKAEHILKENGFEVLTANSGRACLNALQLNKIDLILLDIEMPEMNGFETLEEIRKNPQHANIPVIFVTSDRDMNIVLKAGEAKVHGYVTKPFTEEELLLHVRKSLTGIKRENA